MDGFSIGKIDSFITLMRMYRAFLTVLFCLGNVTNVVDAYDGNTVAHILAYISRHVVQDLKRLVS